MIKLVMLSANDEVKPIYLFNLSSGKLVYTTKLT